MRSIRWTIRRMVVDVLTDRDQQNPTGFWSLDSGTWAHSVYHWALRPKA